jgi:hypothetical protein
MSSALGSGNRLMAPPTPDPQFIRGYTYAVVVLANALAAKNPAFDRARFIADIGVTP